MFLEASYFLIQIHYNIWIIKKIDNVIVEYGFIF